MRLHRNAKLGLAGRFALIQACEQGLSMREVASRFSVSPATVCRWQRRWRGASEDERSTFACLLDRSSRPKHMPRLLPASAQRRICAARRRTGWGPRLLTVRTGHPHSTISKVLRRHGLSRPPRAAREPARRYEWPCPGDLLHMDSTSYARFARPGHALTGDRTSSAAEKRARVGYEYAHAIVDDHSRLAYAELLVDERGATVTAFVARALAFFAVPGHRLWRQVGRNRVPQISVLAIVIASAAIMVPAYWNYLVGYLVGTGIAVIGLYVAFILPVILRFRLGDRFEHGAWSLGRHYKWIDLVAIIWVAFITLIFLLPPYKSSVPWADEFSWEALNYAPILVGGALLLFGGWYVLSARKWFKGPIRMGTEEELERYEEEFEARTGTAPAAS